MTLWGNVTWDVARAGGFTAYLLTALSVATGLALTVQWQSPRWPRLVNSELHNFLTLLALIFTGVHILAVWLDPFTRFGWAEVFIPFLSHYRPLWMALGIVGLYLALAVGLSTWLRSRIGYVWWRRLHLLTLATYALVTVHGLGNGSDTRTWWGALIYAASVVLIGSLLALRLLFPAGQGKRHPLAAGVTALAILGLGIFAALGPLQPGWNIFANNGQGSGARNDVAAPPAARAATDPFGAAFTAYVEPTMTATAPGASE
jgi:predicted ferric reductase